jgi:hypothetical protein
MPAIVNKIPLAGVRAVDPQSGIVDPYWYDFFASLAGGQPLRDFATDALAAAGGVPLNGFYRTGNTVKIRVT